MEKFLSVFGFDPAEHSVKTEVLAGLTTFMTMAYILAVNPIVLGATGMDKGAVFSATIIAAAIATTTMAVYAKLPFVLASAMGLNAFFAYTLVISMGYTWQQALAAVFVEGVVFILLTFFRVREAIVNSIPIDLRMAISVGIGMFVAYIGLKNGQVIVSNESTITALGPWTPTSLIAVGGIIVATALTAKNVRGALFYAIVAMTIIGIPLGVTVIPDDFTPFSTPSSIEPIAFHIDFSRFTSLDFDYIIIVLTLLFMDLFDTIGTLIGAATSAGMFDKNGNVPNLNKALMADAIGTTVGALCGTSTVTTYAESTTGILAGGRTGLTSFTAAILFITSLFFSPLFLIVPSAATTCALFLVGVMMMRPLLHIDFIDFRDAMPCLVIIMTMPFTASISEGIVLGMLSYIAVRICLGQFKELSPIMYIMGVLFILKYIAPMF
jgi:AGZA family xanthine/uracil permease-like MFS transporter